MARFGNDEELTCIVDVALKGDDDEPLCLGYKTTILMVGAGVKISDDGYVLKVLNKPDTYYDMPVGDDLAGLQAEGLLPSPLPSYKLTTMQYALGYSLWIVIAAVVLFSAIAAAIKKARKPPPGPLDPPDAVSEP